MIHYIMITLFVIFMIFLVVGFNKQMIEKNEKRQENEKHRKKNEIID
ncbi:alpha-2,3-sialyltransferase [Campylobacter blaseri]|nr:hypothetical protein [Campylobacter blaseri]QKF85897.1 alpha-2,3-sialyltransferase [Campylobacter blaseri]